MSRSVMLAVLGIALAAGPSAAGMFRFWQGPALPALLDGTDVQLVSAEVDAVLERGPYPPATVLREWNRDRVRLDARLVLRNRTSDPRVIRMGFPLGPEYTSPDDPVETDAGALAARFDLIVRDEKRTYQWYAPVDGRRESNLPYGAPDVIAALDRIRKTAFPRGEITAASLPGPGIRLPEADMAEVPEGLRRMLVIPVPKMFFQPALRIEGNEAATVRRFEEMTDRIRAYADRDRSEVEPLASNLELLILADEGTPLSKILRTWMCGAEPDVRIWRYWFGARDGAGRLAAIPVFLDIEDFGRLGPPSAQRAAHPEGPIEIRLRADGDVAYERLVEILNEARRFGFRIAIIFGADALEAEPPHSGRPGWFHAPDAADLPAGPAPPRVPGKALAQEPFVPPAGSWSRPGSGSGMSADQVGAGHDQDSVGWLRARHTSRNEKSAHDFMIREARGEGGRRSRTKTTERDVDRARSERAGRGAPGAPAHVRDRARSLCRTA